MGTQSNSLQQEIDAFMSEMFKQVPPEAEKGIQEAIQQMIADGIADHSLNVGDAIPSFSLVDTHGNSISSDELLSQGPLVIKFFRGAWCPFCSLEIPALQKILPALKAVHASLIAISPSTQEKLEAMNQKHKIEFPILSDHHNRVAEKFGITFKLSEKLKALYEQFDINLPLENGEDSYKLPIPAAFVVNKNRVITYRYVTADYTKRPEPLTLLEEVKSL